MMTENGSSPLVVLLMDDIKSAQNISLIFRKMGVIPSFFRELKTFWYAIIKDRPKLAIIDVRKMSEGHYFLKDHPLIQSQVIPVAFYYNQESKPLLTSTHDFLHYGLLGEDGPYDLMLKVILERVLKTEKVRSEMMQLQEKLKISRTKYEQLQENRTSEEKSLQTFEGFLLKISKSFNDILSVEKMFDFISDQFSNFAEILEFSLVTLDKNRQKLISPEIFSLKYRPIPELKLGQILDHGIEFFAQNMVLEVELEILGGELVPIHLYGEGRNPDYMFFLKVSDIGKETFSWKILETILNALYSRTLLMKNKSVVKSENSSPSNYPWTILNLVEQQELKKTFILLDFSALVDYLRNEKKDRFYWDAFFKDFMNHLSLDVENEIEFFPLSIEQTALGLDTNHKKRIEDSLDIFVKQFQYQCYFDGVFSTEILEKIQPKIWEVPGNARDILNIL